MDAPRWDLTEGIDPATIADLESAFTPRIACGPSYCPHVPHPKQQAFLLLDDREALYGGAAGGGKSDALLMAALQYVCVPGYRAILFRQTVPQLEGDDGLIPRALEWLAPHLADKTVHWNAQRKRLRFPSGATVSFGHLWLEKDKLNYQGLAYQYVGFDELTHWPSPTAFKYVGFSRVRKPVRSKSLRACPSCGMTVADIPLRTRAGTNPGGPGHGWVKQRYIIPSAERVFLPARLADNPSLEPESYIEGLMELDAVERARLLQGDWDITEEGRLFQRSWFVGSAA